MIPHVFSKVKPQDVTLNPIIVHKRFTIGAADVATTSSGYSLVEGLYFGENIKLGTGYTYPTNSIDGSNKYIIWKSLDSKYYRYPYDSYRTFEHPNERFTYKYLYVSASILNIPQQVFGESIKPGSVVLKCSKFTLKDDGNGNLYDPSIDTGSYPDRSSVVAYWGFNEEFRRVKGLSGNIYDGSIPYTSRTFYPDQNSIVKNVYINQGFAMLSGSFFKETGFKATFNQPGYIRTSNRDELNFSSNDDFTIAFWGTFPISQSNSQSFANSIISKRGVINKQIYDNSGNVYSSSIVNQSTNVYPYHIEIVNQFNSSSRTPEYIGNEGLIVFKRSDGINTTIVTASVSYPVNDTGDWPICITKSGSQISIYIEGFLQSTVTDRTIHPINNHELMFGSEDLDFKNSFSGSIDEVTFFNRALSDSEVFAMHQGFNFSNRPIGPYRTAIVGNVFYKSGTIVISPLDRLYLFGFSGSNWSMDFKSTHCIYQYETLVRIKAGDFNLSQNPSALQAPNTDLLLNEFTGSNPNSDLFPYATTIGLYNEKNELLVVGKLSQPLKMRNDVDLNIIVRFDG